MGVGTRGDMGCQQASKQLGMWPRPAIQLSIQQGSHHSRTNRDGIMGLCCSLSPPLVFDCCRGSWAVGQKTGVGRADPPPHCNLSSTHVRDQLASRSGLPKVTPLTSLNEARAMPYSAFILVNSLV